MLFFAQKHNLKIQILKFKDKCNSIRSNRLEETVGFPLGAFR
jgi:hypothetical protein